MGRAPRRRVPPKTRREPNWSHRGPATKRTRRLFKYVSLRSSQSREEVSIRSTQGDDVGVGNLSRGEMEIGFDGDGQLGSWLDMIE
jgi:hypothetical protein